MKTRNIVRHVLALTLAMVGLLNWNTLSGRSSGQVARAATRARLNGLIDQPALRDQTNGKIAFVSSRGNNDEIDTMDADGSGLKQLTSGPGDFDPDWSPDGTQIVFVRRAAIFVMEADGSNQRQLTQSAIGRYPTWSPDGTKIAFSNGCLGCASSVVYVVNADGTDQRIISRGGAEPAWSPDGSKLAVSSNNLTIDLVNADGSDRTALTAPPKFDAVDTDPAWSPDGSKIAFTRWTGCDFNDCYDPEIWTVNADGTQPTYLGVYGNSLKWSPDGKKLIFSNNGDILLMNADGSGLTNITNSKEVREYEPSWQPLLLSCADLISPTEQSFDANGGIGSVDVTAGTDCAWTATSHTAWIAVTTMSNSGSGSIPYSVEANAGTGSRKGMLIIAGRVFSITQAGVPVIITSASVTGKKLFVGGENFDPGAVILLNGEEQITKNDGDNPKTVLIGKKAGKKIQSGDKLQVRNPNGSRSQEITFTGIE
jgi:TolB protein